MAAIVCYKFNIGNEDKKKNAQQPETSKKGNFGILSSTRASVGALSLSGESGQCKKKVRFA